MPTQLPTVEQKIARLAARAHGIVTRAELLAAKISRDQIAERVRKGALLPEYRGVYRVGHRAESTAATYMAAVKAGGKQAQLAGLAAAHFWELVKGKPPPPEITSPTEREIPDVLCHRSRVLRPVDKTTYRGIRVTSVARTLVDIAGRLSEEELARAVHKAWVRYRTRPVQVERALARTPKAPGAAKLRRVIRGESPLLLSRLERGFHRLLRDAGLPLPQTNRHADGRYVDCRWPEHKLTVELDSYAFHNSSHSWKQDHRREREAYARGDDFRRYTWEDVTDLAQATLSELRPLLT